MIKSKHIQTQILGYVLENSEQGVTAGEIRRCFSFNAGTLNTHLQYLQAKGFLKVRGTPGAYRWYPTEAFLGQIAEPLAEVKREPKNWKWLGLAVLAGILLSQDDKDSKE